MGKRKGEGKGAERARERQGGGERGENVSLSPAYRSSKPMEMATLMWLQKVRSFGVPPFIFRVQPDQPTVWPRPSDLGQSRDRRAVRVTVLAYEPVHGSYPTVALFRFFFSCVLCLPPTVLLVVSGMWRMGGEEEGGESFL